MSNKHKKKHQKYALEQLDECDAILSAFAVINGISIRDTRSYFHPYIFNRNIRDAFLSNKPDEWVQALNYILESATGKYKPKNYKNSVVSDLLLILKKFRKIYED